MVDPAGAVRTFGIAVEAPGRGLPRDAPPGGAFLGRRHHGPVLHFVEAAAAAFADVVALAGGTDRDAGRVGGRRIPREPGVARLRRHRVLVAGALVVVHHQRV